MTTRIIQGDCRDVLKTLPDQSVHCCVTSPPYWGLRSYLPAGHPDKHLEIGSEPTLQAWVQTMVQVFREVRRVLRDDGTLWLNLGDAYAGSWGAQSREHAGKHAPNISAISANQAVAAQRRESGTSSLTGTPGLKAKDLMGQPWRVAFALQDDGWYLRQELIWAKKNPMPESCRDRFTKSHEQVFLLTKSQRYYFDIDAVQEAASDGTHARYAANGGKAPQGAAWGHGDLPRDAAGLSAYKQRDDYKKGASRDVGVGHNARPRKAVPNDLQRGVGHRQGPPGNPAPKSALNAEGTKNNASFNEAMAVMPATRNPRSVRWLASEPFSGAHFATYPSELIRPFIAAGCPVGGTVLDPFGGSGTTGLEADRQHKHAILVDLDERNVPMATGRIQGASPLFAEVTA
jgi:site-specific DNA-methyltransferase (cytosine-N4-specific)